MRLSYRSELELMKGWTFAERFSCIDDCSTKSEGWNLVTAPYWGPLVQDRLNIPKWAIRWFSISLRECERCNHLTLCTSCLGSRGVTIIAQSGGPGSLNPEGKCWILETSAGRHMAQLARPDTAGSPLLGWNVERALYEAWDMSEQLQIRKVL